MVPPIDGNHLQLQPLGVLRNYYFLKMPLYHFIIFIPVRNGISNPTALPLACPQPNLNQSSYEEDCLSMILYVPATTATGRLSTLMWLEIVYLVSTDVPLIDFSVGFMEDPSL
jgi:hypothetical protein